jgi:hypothetical protein
MKLAKKKKPHQVDDMSQKLSEQTLVVKPMLKGQELARRRGLIKEE